DLAFTVGGTESGPEGATERDTILAGLAPDMVAHLRDRSERGLTITAVAESPTDGVVAVGSYQPVERLAALLAVATLPPTLRRPLAVDPASRASRCASREARAACPRRRGANRAAVRPKRGGRQGLRAGRIPTGRHGTRRRARAVTVFSMSALRLTQRQ